VNSSHGELVTCDEFTVWRKSELVTMNLSQRLSQGKVNSPHGDHQTVNSSLRLLSGLGYHIAHIFEIQTSDCFICLTCNTMYNVNEVQTQAISTILVIRFQTSV